MSKTLAIRLTILLIAAMIGGVFIYAIARNLSALADIRPVVNEFPIGQ
jgi:hypothetical protein